MNSMALSVMSSEKWGSSLLRRLRLVHRMVVVSELRVPLTCLGAEEAVPPFEASPGGPVAAGRGEVHLDGGAQVPFAHHVGVPAPLAENLGQHAVLGRDRAAGVREPTGTLGDAGHAVAGVVAAGQQTRPRRRAQGCGVPLRVPDTIAGDLVYVRRLDRPPVAGHRRVPDVIQDDVEDVGRPLGCLWRCERRPVLHRVPDVDVDLALEWHAHGSSI
jgi:hypothetical protein